MVGGGVRLRTRRGRVRGEKGGKDYTRKGGSEAKRAKKRVRSEAYAQWKAKRAKKKVRSKKKMKNLYD